jgi:predicted nucleic acid-binding protein
MTVVSDTSCITTLLKAAQLGLAEALCGVLQVPTAVWEELVVFHQQVPAGVVRTGANGGARLASGLDELGRGEAEAITLALQISADLFLTDDQEAARAARQLGLKVIGTVGLTLLAKRKGLIPSVRETLDLLQERGGLYLSEAVRLEALRLAGEE